LEIGFIDHFNTKLVTTPNYSAIANFHNLQFNRVHTKSFPVRSVFSSSCLVTAPNNGYSSASGLKFSLNNGSLPTELFFRVRVRITLRLSVYRLSVRLGDNPLRLTTSNFKFQLNTCGYSPYVTPSLTRGWVCRLKQ
jgi:hypothetical protein